MLKVIDIFRIGDKLSVTIEGRCEQLKNGSKLIDNDNNKIYEVISAAMTRNNNPEDFSKTTTVLMPFCDIAEGIELEIA